jgi:hypothetical protein
MFFPKYSVTSFARSDTIFALFLIFLDFMISITFVYPILSLINEFIDTTGLWLEFGTGSGISTNQISHYYQNTLYSFDSFTPNPYNRFKNAKQIAMPSHLNNNIEIITGWFLDTIPDFTNKYLSEKEKENYISFLHIDCDSYQSTCQVLNELCKYIKDGCMIVFGKLLNFSNFHLHQLKSFYEFVQKYKIKFKWIGMNSTFSKSNDDFLKTFPNTRDEAVAIKIIHNPFFNISSNIIQMIKEEETEEDTMKEEEEEDENFDWEKYVIYYGNGNKRRNSKI